MSTSSSIASPTRRGILRGTASVVCLGGTCATRRATELSEPSRTKITRDHAATPQRCRQTGIWADRTQEVGGSSPPSSTYRTPAHVGGSVSLGPVSVCALLPRVYPLRAEPRTRPAVSERRRPSGSSALPRFSSGVPTTRCGRETARRARCSDALGSCSRRTSSGAELESRPHSTNRHAASRLERLNVMFPLRRSDSGRVKPCESRRRRPRSRGSCSRSVWSAGSSPGRTRTPGRGPRGGQ